MSHPRYVLVLGHRVGNRLVPPWPGAGRTLDGADAPKAWIAWRLLGSNHREIARSAAVFPDVATGLASILRLRTALEEGGTETAIETVDRLWGWAVRVDATAVAVASRFYFRQRECEYSCQVFLASAAIAELPATAPAQRPGSPDELKVAAE